MLDLSFGVAWSLHNVLKVGISLVWAIEISSRITTIFPSAHCWELRFDCLPELRQNCVLLHLTLCEN